MVADDSDTPRGLSLIWPDEQHQRSVAVQWVVRDLLRTAAVGCVYGLPGTFKSYLVLDLAICVVHGLESFLDLPIEKHGPVLIISADDGADTTIERLRKIALFRLGNAEYDRIVLVDRGQLSLRDGAARLLLEGALADCYEKFRIPTALVIIDTAAMAGAPTEDFGHNYPQVLGWLKRVASSWGCCIVLVDHAAQPSANRPKLDVRVGMWGSTMKAGFFEFAWELKKPAGSDDPRVVLAASDKRSPRRPQFALTFGNDEDSYQLEAVAVSGPTTVDDRILAALADQGQLSNTQLEESTGQKRDSVRRSVGRLVSDRRVKEVQPARGRKPALYALPMN